MRTGWVENEEISKIENTNKLSGHFWWFGARTPAPEREWAGWKRWGVAVLANLECVHESPDPRRKKMKVRLERLCAIPIKTFGGVKKKRVENFSRLCAPRIYLCRGRKHPQAAHPHSSSPSRSSLTDNTTANRRNGCHVCLSTSFELVRKHGRMREFDFISVGFLGELLCRFCRGPSLLGKKKTSSSQV